MLDKNRFALKEWAVILEALSEGRQILLLRKGGLIERRMGFKVEHREFFIYPTYLHQQRRGIVPAWRTKLETILTAAPSDDEVVLSHYAVVKQIFNITDSDQIRPLSHFHILNPEEVQKRFFYGRSPGLHLMLLRTFRLAKPFRMRFRSVYGGCRSWVDLERELPTSGCRPVLDDAAFGRETRRIVSCLDPKIRP